MQATNALILLTLATDLIAQWPNTPATNVPVGDGIGTQAVPRIAATNDGGCYVAWFDTRGGSQAVYVQRLDGHGAEQWVHGGVLVSNHPQNSSLIGWDMIADSENHCVLTFTDVRNGPDLDVYAYRIAPNGTLVWGGNGVTLSSNTNDEGNPTVCETTDGDFVFFWPNTSLRTIQMQRLDRLGAPRFAGDGIGTLGDTGVAPAFVHAVAGDLGSAIAVWVRGLAFSAVKHLHMQKWNPAGTPLWNGGTRLPVFDQTSVPIVHEPRIVGDGAGGAVVGWHFSVGSQFSSRVQRVLANGTEQFAHNGVDLSTNGNSRFDPSIVWLPATQEILAVFNERNIAQSQWGITAQKIDASGARMFGASGLTVIPISGTERQVPNAVRSLDGLLAFVSEVLPTPNTYKVLGLRVDSAGNVWTPPVDIATFASQKIRTVAAVTQSGTAFAAWSDTRSDGGDVYAQNLNPDGSLGDKLATVTVYGCGTNPAGSLSTSGRPAIGTTMQLGVDNPLGTQAAGALAVLAVGFAPAVGFPCGQLVAGYGMASAGANGEILLSSPAIGLTLLAGPWAGPLQPVQFSLSLPPGTWLYGMPLYAQGLLLDLQLAAAVPIGLSTAVRLVIGS